MTALLLKASLLQGQTSSLPVDTLKLDTPRVQYKGEHPHRCQIAMYKTKRKAHSINLMLKEMIEGLKIEQ